MVLVLLTPLNCYMSTLRLIHYALLLASACRKSNNTDSRLVAFALFLALDSAFGIHSHKTSETAQPCHLLKSNWKPSSSHRISAPTNINTQLLPQSLCVRACVRVCVRACVRVCVCVCVFPYVNCFGGTVLYVRIEYCILVNMYDVRVQGVDEHMIYGHYYYCYY